MRKADSTGNDQDRLTVLTTIGPVAVKTHTELKDGTFETKGYDKAKRFRQRSIKVDSKGAWLEELGPDRHSFVVMGAPVDWAQGEVKTRTTAGDLPTLVDVPRRWMPVDIDKIDFEPMFGPDDGEGLALEVMQYLGIKGSRCVWHLTGSHGIDGKFRIRLWVRLKNPITCAQMLRFAEAHWENESLPLTVDMTVYRAGQPIYTGDPIFVGGSRDPFAGRRVGYISGESLDAVVTEVRPHDEQDPRPDDPNIEMLDKAGLYIEPIRGELGKHLITCPWADEHTHGERTATYLAPHFAGHDVPNFNCFHDHCKDRTWNDVANMLGASFRPVADEDVASNWLYITRMKKFRDPRDGEIVDIGAYAAKTKKPDDKQVVPKFLKVGGLAVERLEFTPGEKRIMTKNGVATLNTYVDRRIEPDTKLDQSPLLEQIEYMIPDQSERDHACDWMAHAYQHPELKILHALLFYGRQGNGKTTVMWALGQCIGADYEHCPTPEDMKDKFNGWCYEKLLVRIEELKSGAKYDIADKLKTVVSNNDVSVRLMHRNLIKVANFANVFASTNHFDSLPIEDSDRRYMIIDTRRGDEPVSKRDTRRLVDLNVWLKDRRGLHAVAAYLAQRDVTGFGYSATAPDTEIKGNMREASYTKLESAVVVARGLQDMDIVTSTMLIAFLSANNCDYWDSQIGNVAGQLKWLPMNAINKTQRNRTWVGKVQEAIWSPTRNRPALERFNMLSHEERAEMVAKFNSRPIHAADAVRKRRAVPGSGTVVPPKAR